MLLFELFTPKGTLDAERRRGVAERLIAEVVTAGEGATPAAHETARAMRELSWVVVHEPDAWFAGEPEASGDGPRYVVRITVTAGALSEAKRAHVVAAVTRALAEAEDDPERLRREPDAWIHLVEVPDGGWGAMGRVLTRRDVVQTIRDRCRPVAA